MRDVGGPPPLGSGVRPGLKLQRCHSPPGPRSFLPLCARRSVAACCGGSRSGAVRLSTGEGPGLRTAGAQAGRRTAAVRPKPPAATLGPGLPRGEGSAPATRGAGAPLKRPSGLLLSCTGGRISSPRLWFSCWRAGAHSVASVSAVQPRERVVRARPPQPPEFLLPASRPYPAPPRAPAPRWRPVYASGLLAPFTPPSSSPAAPTSLASVSASIPTLRVGSSVPFFQISYTYVLIHDI